MSEPTEENQMYKDLEKMAEIELRKLIMKAIQECKFNLQKYTQELRDHFMKRVTKHKKNLT